MRGKWDHTGCLVNKKNHESPRELGQMNDGDGMLMVVVVVVMLEELFLRDKKGKTKARAYGAC